MITHVNGVPVSELTGRLSHDRLGYSEYVKVDGVFVKHWIWDRLADIPSGAIVRISAEVLDAHPDA